jgi:Ribbon-Helix-Helix transcriptional regulator family
VPQTLLRSASPDESSAAISTFVQQITQDLIDALTRSLRDPEGNPGKTMFDGEIVWMTNEELVDVAAQVSEIFDAYRTPGDVPGRRERVFAQFSYPAPTPANILSAPQHVSPGEPTIRRVVFAGVFQYTRHDLENVVARNEKLDIRMAGVITMAPDITPDLVDRAIARFRSLGIVHASREVREALKRKEV